MARTLARVLLCGLMTLAGAGCSTRMAAWTAISTRNVRLHKMDIDKLPSTDDVSGRSARWIILFIPLGKPHIEEAVEDALRKGDGDLMVDAVLYNEVWYFLVGRFGWRVRGTVVRTAGHKAATAAHTGTQ